MFAFSLGPLDLEELEALEKQLKQPAVRKQVGKKTKGMSEKQLRDSAKKVRG
jgi:hypothetical protein